MEKGERGGRRKREWEGGREGGDGEGGDGEGGDGEGGEKGERGKEKERMGGRERERRWRGRGGNNKYSAYMTVHTAINDQC